MRNTLRSTKEMKMTSSTGASMVGRPTIREGCGGKVNQWQKHLLVIEERRKNLRVKMSFSKLNFKEKLLFF